MRGRAERNLVLPSLDILTATGAPVESQGTLEVNIQMVDVHGEAVTAKAVFELLPVHRPV